MHTHAWHRDRTREGIQETQNYFLHVEEPYQKFDSCQVSALVLPAEATQIMSTFLCRKLLQMVRVNYILILFFFRVKQSWTFKAKYLLVNLVTAK